MPGLEEAERYIRGVLLLARNRKEGFQWLDISADGFWHSFWAIVYSLPALAVSWASYRIIYLQTTEQPASAGIGFVARLALIDLLTWVLPLVILGLLAKPLGFERHFARFVIATNWLGVVTTYALAVPSLIRLLPFGEDFLAALISIAVFVLTILLLYRVTRMAFDGEAMNAAGVTLGMIVLSIMLSGLFQNAFGVAIA